FPNSALPTAMEGQQPAPTWVCRSRWPWMAPAACTSLMRVSSVTGLTGSARSRLTESLPLLPEADLLDIPGTADRPSVHPLTARGGSLSIRLATSTWRIRVTTSSACFGQALLPRVEPLFGLLPVHCVPPGGDVIRPAVLILEIVGVLPHVEADHGEF